MSEEQNETQESVTGFFDKAEEGQFKFQAVAHEIASRVSGGVSLLCLGTFAATKAYAGMGGPTPVLPVAFLYVGAVGAVLALGTKAFSLYRKEQLMYNEMEMTRKKRETNRSRMKMGSSPTHQPI